MAKKSNSKPKVVKDFDKLPKEVIAAIKAEFPNGFSHKMIAYTTPKGEKVMALPFDLDDISYLVRVTILDSKSIARGDDDDDDVEVAVKTPRVSDDLNLDDLDIDGLKDEDDSFSDSSDDEDEDYKPRSTRRTRDEEDSDEDY